MVNKKLQDWRSTGEPEISGDGTAQQIYQEDDYEFLDNIDFLQHIDLSSHNSVHYLTNDIEEEEEEISVKVDFLEDLTFFDELDYFDELNKALEREVSEMANKENPRWDRNHKWWSRVTAKGILRMVGIVSALMFTSIGIALTVYLTTRPSESTVDMKKEIMQNTLGNENEKNPDIAQNQGQQGGNPVPVKKEPDKPVEPSIKPTVSPTVQSSAEPTVQPSAEPAVQASSAPSVNPTASEVENAVVVDKAFFDDAVFIGNSLTLGLQLSSDLPNATFLAAKSLNVTTALNTKVIRQKGTTKQISILEALEGNSYKKVYIMFGTNELGWPSAKTFGEKYEDLVKAVQRVQPDAEIYIQSILPVSKSKSDSTSIYTNAHIVAFNKELKAVATRMGVNYLDVASAVINEKGALPEEASSDGVHLNKSYCKKWLSYIEKNS